MLGRSGERAEGGRRGVLRQRNVRTKGGKTGEHQQRGGRDPTCCVGNIIISGFPGPQKSKWAKEKYF